ncbi:hypothetical protein [Streptomyces sp. NPDC002209]|uniref:hypothetical protein n=1 Tax=Streptomyces sp. NPDC002209 TaxID=3364638 RepID=UPI0036AEACCA
MDDVIALQEAVAEAADAMAWPITERARAHRAAGQEAPDRVVLSGDYQLTLLYALRQVQAAVEEQAACACVNAPGAVGSSIGRNASSASPRPCASPGRSSAEMTPTRLLSAASAASRHSVAPGSSCQRRIARSIDSIAFHSTLIDLRARATTKRAD